MVKTGLDQIRAKLPPGLKGRKIGILCHAPSVAADYSHITEIISEREDCFMTAIFGPQHGIYGQTQDNMIEWKSIRHPLYRMSHLQSLRGKKKTNTGNAL